MISGINLATALSVMLHMEQEGNGMDKMNKTEELSERLKYVADILDTHSEKLPVPPHIRLHATKAREAADRLSEQQQVIDELHSALWGVRENLIRLAWDENTVMIEGIDKALSRSKDYK